MLEKSLDDQLNDDYTENTKKILSVYNSLNILMATLNATTLYQIEWRKRGLQIQSGASDAAAAYLWCSEDNQDLGRRIAEPTNT